MVDPSVMDDLRGALDSWLAAFRSVDSLNREMLSLDMRRQALAEKEADAVTMRDKAESTVNGILSGVADEDADDVRALIADYAGRAVSVESLEVGE